MAETPKPAPTPITDDENAESRMRLALGLRGAASSAGHAPQQRADQARARHKFVQDGGVPVVMLNRSHDQDAQGQLKTRIGDLERQLEHERTAHTATRRLVAEAQSALQQEKTRAAHAELAHADALAAGTRALEVALIRTEPAPTPVLTPASTLAPTSEPAPASTLAFTPASTSGLAVAPDMPDRPKRGRPPRKPAIDRSPIERISPAAKPVRWWTPSYRAKKV